MEDFIAISIVKFLPICLRWQYNYSTCLIGSSSFKRLCQGKTTTVKREPQFIRMKVFHAQKILFIQSLVECQNSF